MMTDKLVAKVDSQPVFQLPDDLYIPPDAMEVFLEAFQGPLDLLLYLIKKQNLDILDIPIAQVTHQYVSYIELMKNLRLELAADYLVMASVLAEIKSKMLLPKRVTEQGEEEDPRAELIRRLQIYEQFKKAAEELDTLPRYERDIFPGSAQAPELEREPVFPDVDLKDLLFAFKSVLERVQIRENYQVSREVLSVRERMTMILSRIKSEKFIAFESLFDVSEGRMGVVVSFISILELLKQSMIEIIQNEPMSPIHVKGVST